MKRGAMSMRIVGIVGMVLGALDLGSVIVGIPRILGSGAHFMDTSRGVVISMSVVSGLFSCFLIALGARAMRSPDTAARALAWLFSIELIYFASLIILPTISSELGLRVGAAFGVGMLGMSFQIFTALPLWGGVLSMLAMRRKRADAGHSIPGGHTA